MCIAAVVLNKCYILQVFWIKLFQLQKYWFLDTQNCISTEILKNWLADAMLCYVILNVVGFSYRVKFSIKYGGKDTPLMMIPGNQRFTWKTAKKCCLNSEKRLWIISQNLLKKTYRYVSTFSILHWRHNHYLDSANERREEGKAFEMWN